MKSERLFSLLFPLLPAGQWAAGPTAVALKQEGPWTYGAPVNHLASFAGDNTRTDVNATESRLVVFRNQPVRLYLAVRYCAEGPAADHE